jgi:hypothetical protein
MLESNPAVQIVHVLRHRAHLRVPALAQHRNACQRVADRLTEQFAGHRVAVRPETGSVIVEVKAGQVDAASLADRLALLIAAEHDDEQRSLLEPRPGKGRPSDLARAIASACRGLNADVRAALDGKGDIASIVPVVLAASSAVQVMRLGEIAAVPWYNLLWYSMRSFLSFNPAVTGAARVAADESAPGQERSG